jgi:hypothetical protein
MMARVPEIVISDVLRKHQAARATACRDVIAMPLAALC